jgi:hypothetical protein
VTVTGWQQKLQARSLKVCVFSPIPLGALWTSVIMRRVNDRRLRLSELAMFPRQFQKTPQENTDMAGAHGR